MNIIFNPYDSTAAALRVGIKKAKELCLRHKLPLIPVNHLEGHALVFRIQQKKENRTPFPFLVLLLSGGHSQLLICKNVGDYMHLGGTIDDSLGEAYDKVARLLGLSVLEGVVQKVLF